VTQAVNDDGAYVYSYTYPWLVPNGAEDPMDGSSRVPVGSRKFMVGSGWRLALSDPVGTPTSVATGYASPRDAVATAGGAQPIGAGTEVTMADVCPITCNRCGSA
jgi:hypothetical protein